MYKLQIYVLNAGKSTYNLIVEDGERSERMKCYIYEGLCLPMKFLVALLRLRSPHRCRIVFGEGTALPKFVGVIPAEPPEVDLDRDSASRNSSTPPPCDSAASLGIGADPRVCILGGAKGVPRMTGFEADLCFEIVALSGSAGLVVPEEALSRFAPAINQ